MLNALSGHMPEISTSLKVTLLGMNADLKVE